SLWAGFAWADLSRKSSCLRTPARRSAICSEQSRLSDSLLRTERVRSSVLIFAGRSFRSDRKHPEQLAALLESRQAQKRYGIRERLRLLHREGSRRRHQLQGMTVQSGWSSPANPPWEDERGSLEGSRPRLNSERGIASRA